jgi:serine/threonine-protein kinase
MGAMPALAWIAMAGVGVLGYALGFRSGVRRRRAPSADPAAGAAGTSAAVPAATPAAASAAPVIDISPRDAGRAMRSASVPAAATAAPVVGVEPALRPERAMLGRYRIDRQLGRGSMGTVYLGHDPQIGRPVAIKTMALGREFEGTELADARARFFREAEMAGRLRHRDIVTIFDASEDQGLAFIAMEYVRGHDLMRYTLPGKLLPVPVVLSTLARVARALAHAHRQGVVHRDVKPANVMIDTAGGTVKVTDFGIARITDACRTRTGLVLGTPSFMSPEQMAGRPVDGRTDLYSLGVMLFQLLTGALPHRSESMAQLLHQIANDPAPDVRTLRPELPESLANVVALALEKRPEVRYADGQQVASDLLAVAREIGGQEPPEPPDAATDSSDPGGFEVTMRLPRADPRHNSDDQPLPCPSPLRP